MPADHRLGRRDGEHEGTRPYPTEYALKNRDHCTALALARVPMLPQAERREAEEPACYGGVHAARMTSSSFNDAGRRHELRTVRGLPVSRAKLPNCGLDPMLCLVGSCRAF